MDSVYCGFALQRVRCSGKVFQVTDESGKVCYRVKQKQFSFGKKMVISDAFGNDEAVIRQSLSLIVPKYRICIAGTESFEIKRKLKIAPQYEISGFHWTVAGNVSQLRCYAGEDRMIFKLQRATKSWMDRFYIEVYDEKYSLHGICIAIAIDAAIDDIRKTGRK